LIDWAARKQVIISTSITETELLAMLHANKEFMWWIHLFEKLKFDFDQKMIIYRIFIDWHHRGYDNTTLRLRWHHSSVTLTSANQIR
jgi:hypothetical protein